MKKVILSMFVALVATVAVQAQQIAVVTSDGKTTICRTLPAAIQAATDNSVIYLPGGGFPISDEVKITRPLTIIGIGHKVNGENADGYTTISGNLNFDEGSSQSAVLGCYITGNVVIGSASAAVNDVTVRYCNLNAVDVMNVNCMETVVNQCYVRGISEFHGANGHFTHNVAKSIYKINNGFVEYNIFTSGDYVFGSNSNSNCSESTSIVGNIFTGTCNMFIKDCLTSDNMRMGSSSFGDNPVKPGLSSSQLFENPAGVTPVSNFHFKEDYKEYESQCGIYVSNGFNQDQLPPVPYIVNHRIPEQTDADGKLNIKIRVRAGQ